MKMLYFAWVRDVIGLESEEIELPQNVKTAGELMEWLKKKGEGYAKVIEAGDAVKMAVNQEYAGSNYPVKNKYIR